MKASEATSQITVRGVDPDLLRALRSRARDRGLSLNRAALEVLREGLGLTRRDPGRYTDLDHLAGTWTTAEAAEFDSYLRRSRRVDKKLWR